MIERKLKQIISSKKDSNKAIIIIGARQVGKTTLLKEFLLNKQYLFLNGDDPQIRETLSNANTEELKRIIGKHKILFFDEAQRIHNIGLTLKLIIDQFEEVQLYVSGSSSFELTQNINEPLTGRKWEYQLYPISWEELENHIGYLTSEQQLKDRLIYGMYPEIINHQGNEEELLVEIANSYLYKDLLAFSNIRKPWVLEKLLRALALQIGSEVSLNELSKTIGIDKNTVNNYIDILKKGFVIFSLSSFSRNMRNEIKNNQKIYFYDLGIRNVIINNFNNIDDRADKGAIWENFLIAERIKNIAYQTKNVNYYFWRTTSQQEIDWIEERNGKIKAFDFKWSDKKVAKTPLKFQKTYQAEVETITPKNFRDFISINF